MNTLPPDALLAQLNWRYATKKFDPSKKIPADAWAALEHALLLTPSSFGLQPWKFIVITDPAVKQKLVPVSWNQTQPTGCSHHIVFAVRKALAERDVDRFLDSIVATRGGAKESLKGYGDVMTGFAGKAAEEGWLREWAVRQVYIALGNFMTCAAVLGVDTCPMEGIEPANYDKIIGLEGTEFETVVACAAGYRAADDKHAQLAKVRFPASEVIQHI
ncbi:MAG: NAD(P)H-dependent oxidoreductase [Chthoniobacteraceae bacterium]